MSRHTPRTRTYLAMAARVKREETHCWLCREPIDPGLRYPHPLSFACDHIVPASQAPHLAEARENLRASHRKCNGRRGNRAPTPQGSPRLLVIDDW